ncbi:small oligopeptide transporter, partial [Mycena pura]
VYLAAGAAITLECRETGAPPTADATLSKDHEITGTGIGEEERPSSRVSQFNFTEKTFGIIFMPSLESAEVSLDSPRASQHDFHSSSFDINIDQAQMYDAFDPNTVENGGELGEEDSPYPEVRSAVANFDDPEMAVSTLRSWTIGLLFSILIPGMNQFFHFRYPSVNIGPVVAQLIGFPIGRAWARWVPAVSIFGVPLNPGPFTIKEHVLITVMAGVGSGSAYATDLIAVQNVFYGQEFNFIFKWMLVVSTQCIGFSIGGVTRRFLVSPPSMIWPNTLVTCALFNTLHSQSYAGIGKHPGMSREHFFLYAFIGSAVWYFLPGYLFQALSYFSWVCWIAPDNIIVNQLFGYRSGLGFSILTFDWNQIAYIGVRALVPRWAEANILISFSFFFWFLVPILYYTNVWHAQYLPISSANAFDNTGMYYNHSRIISNGKLDLEAYKAYSPVYLSTTFAMSYGLSFMSITATIVHAIIHFSAPIKLHFKRSLREQPDVHAKLMLTYPQVPDYYYACIFIVTFIFACICIECWDTGMTIWALILALAVALLYVVPVGMIQAITNCEYRTAVITELLVGFLLPGKGDNSYGSSIQFTMDFKLGHYMKIPPRYGGEPRQILSLIAPSTHCQTAQLGIQSWCVHYSRDMCSQTQKDYFNCAFTQVFGTASVIWGLIGPGLFFSKGQKMIALTFFFVIGAACPILQWLITRRRPNTILNYLRLIFSALGVIPPATAVNFIPWAGFGFIFQYVIRRKHFAYWTKYNYVLSAALDAGTAVGLILVFFCLQYPLHGSIGGKSVLEWWGNQVFTHTLDWTDVSL